MTNEQLLANLKSLASKSGLQEVQEVLVSKAKPAIALVSSTKSASDRALAQSKIGGRPDVPANFVWPTKEAKPLSFIAQINLGHLPFIESSNLPNSGLLSFFYNNEVWGFDPKDKGGFQVFYFENELSELKECQPPAAAIEKKFFGMISKAISVEEYDCCALEPELILTLPNELKNIDLSEEDTEKYCELLETIGGHHRLLGYPEPIQGEMEIECELVTNGHYCGNSSGYNDPRASELEKRAHHWQLLLQVDSDDNANMMWGDAGRLYFWIKNEDLAARRFNNCWMISQCY